MIGGRDLKRNLSIISPLLVAEQTLPSLYTVLPVFHVFKGIGLRNQCALITKTRVSGGTVDVYQAG